MNTSLWEDLAACIPASRTDLAVVATLVTEYERQGYVRRTCRTMLELPDAAIIAFYRALSQTRSDASPVCERPDSGWMADADFCFINVRATGLGERPGSFLQAAKLLPALRVNAIHLAPFTDYDFSVIYAVRSTRAIAPQLVDPTLALSAEVQLQTFVAAAHMLGMAVGFDLEPHVAQFAVPVLMRPELFRWIALSSDREALLHGLTMDEMLTEEMQQTIITYVRVIVDTELRASGLDSLEVAPDDDSALRERRRATYFRLIKAVIGAGLWTIPSQSWAGAGVPAFAGYNHQDNYARFAYCGPNGEDLSGSAFHILTPYKLQTELRANRPSAGGVPFQPGIDAYSAVFAYWRDGFDFDFVRYDSVDHIIDSLVDGDLERPAADRPTPAVLRTCIERSRSPARPYIGNFAERMGLELEPYAAIGFDLMLGTNMLRRVDRSLIEDSIRLSARLEALNQERAARFAVPFCIDTHDTGNPGLWCAPLVQVVGGGGMRLRHVVSRFLGAGLARRPKYEVMGSQDLSYGLYAANVGEVNLTWVGDTTYNAGYHRIEDVYTILRPLLDRGSLGRWATNDWSAWWVIVAGTELLVVAIGLESDQPRGGDMVVELAELLPSPDSDLTEYQMDNQPMPPPILDQTVLRLGLLPLGCRIVRIGGGSA
jgi:hypothetical protein